MWGIDDAALATLAASAVSSGVQMATAGKTNARGSRLAHRQHEWQINDMKMQREWALEDWQRNADFLSPKHQIELAQQAGISPMSVVNNGNITPQPTQSSVSPTSPPAPHNFIDPGASIPSMINAANNVLSNVLAAKKLTHEIDNIDADTQGKLANAEYKMALAKTENAIRNNKINYLGVQVELGHANASLSNQRVKEIAQSITESQQRIENLKQTCLEIGANISLKQFQMYCAKIKLPRELELMASQALLNMQRQYTDEFLRLDRRDLLQAQTKSFHSSSRYTDTQSYMNDLYIGDPSDRKKSYYMTHLYNENYSEKFDAQTKEQIYYQSKGHTKSPLLYNVDNAMESVSNVITPINKTLQGFMYHQIGKSRIMPASLGNPASPSSGYNVSKKPLHPSDGYSEKLGGWMPIEYFDHM